MEQKALSRVYIKTVFMAALVTALCLAGGIYTKSWKTCVMAVLPAAWGFVSVFSLKRCLARGEIISVYAVCTGHEGKKFRIANGQTGRVTTHRFVAATNDDASSGPFANETHCFFLNAVEDKFREGETFCFLFRKRADGRFGDSNLLTYLDIPPDLCYFDAAEQGNGEEPTETVETAEVTDVVEKRVPIRVVPGSKNARNNAIMFPPTNNPDGSG